MSRTGLTFVILDEKGERGKLWTKITGGCVFEATPPIGGFFRLTLSQFDQPTLDKICVTLAARQGGQAHEVRAYFKQLGYIPLQDGVDATFGANLRMLV